MVGYGSIGKRHDEVLQKLSYDVDIVSKQTIKNRLVYKNLETIENLAIYDYFVIASETYKHFTQLSYLESRLSDKIIFCEKPLFQKYQDLNIVKNRVQVGYVLRFHPLLEKLKNLIKDEKVISINVNCGQYLPTWRVGVDYRDSYSAKKDEGGGVLLDLSHEIDYMQWLCGTMQELKSYRVKISDLEIDSDDMTTFIGKTTQGVLVNLSIDYINKIVHREIILHTINATYKLNFIENTLDVKNKQGEKKVYNSDTLERNYMFTKMHQAILEKDENACTYEEGQEIMKTITTIQEQNND